MDERAPAVERGPGEGFGDDGGDDDFFGGDVSSICIKPDQIEHDQNIANE